MTLDERTEERIAQYVEGAMAGDELAAFEEELARSPELASKLYDVMNVRAVLLDAADARGEELRASHLASARAEAKAERRSWWRLPAIRWAVPIAAVAVCAVIVVNVADGPGDSPTFRSAPRTLETLSPAGALSEPPRSFTWTGGAGAMSYRFELFDGAARPVHAAIVSDTSLTIGDEVEIPTLGYWQVTPLDEINVAGRSTEPLWYRVD